MDAATLEQFKAFQAFLAMSKQAVDSAEETPTPKRGRPAKKTPQVTKVAEGTSGALTWDAMIKFCDANDTGPGNTFLGCFKSKTKDGKGYKIIARFENSQGKLIEVNLPTWVVLGLATLR